MYTEREPGKNWLDTTPSKTAFIFGLILGLAVAFIIGFFILLNLVLGDGKVALGKTTANSNRPVAAANQPTAAAAPAPSPSAPVDIQITDSDHVRGSSNAKVTLVEFSDFQCPFCGRFFPSLQKLLSEYGDQVRLVYRHFPLDSIHQMARPAAEASECASEQGKFWEYHDQLFAKQDELSNDLLKQIASDLKLNTNKFNDCFNSGKYRQEVEDDYQSGIAAGVRGTPHTIVNGVAVSGAVPYDQLKAVIDEALKS